jgi:hypothetical protein
LPDFGIRKNRLLEGSITLGKDKIGYDSFFNFLIVKGKQFRNSSLFPKNEEWFEPELFWLESFHLKINLSTKLEDS